MGEGLMLPCSKIVRGQQRLTPEQEAYAREFADERIAAQLSTAAIDEQEAERHLREAYRVAELPPPARIRWFDSPLSFIQASAENSLDGPMMYSGDLYSFMLDRAKPCMKAYVTPRRMGTVEARELTPALKSVSIPALAFENHGAWAMKVHVKDNAYSLMWGSAHDRIEARVQAHLEEDRVATLKRVWEACRMENEEEVSVWRRMVDCVLSRVWPSTWDWKMHYFMVNNVANSIEYSADKSVQAYNNAREVTYYRFLHEVFEKNRAIHLALLNERVSGYYLKREEAWLVRKPIILERDEAGRFHSASGMCMQYRDGWGFYAWHGVSVSEQIIMHPEQVTRTNWMEELNAEKRRVIQERLGMERFIEMLGGKQIDAGSRGKLIEIDLGYREPERVARYVQVQDSSTERQYYLRVPPTITSADEAVAWTFGLDARDYQPGQET